MLIIVPLRGRKRSGDNRGCLTSEAKKVEKGIGWAHLVVRHLPEAGRVQWKDLGKAGLTVMILLLLKYALSQALGASYMALSPTCAEALPCQPHVQISGRDTDSKGRKDQF